MVKQEEVKFYLEEQFDGNISVLDRKTGYSNWNFTVEIDGDYFVYRCNRPDIEEENRLEIEYRVLEALECLNFGYSPEPVRYFSEKETELIEYIEGDVIDPQELPPERLAQIFADIHSLDTEALQRKIPEDILRNTNTPEEDVEQFGVQRYEDIEGNKFSSDFMDWISEQLEAVKKEAGKIPSGRTGFVHGDISSSLIGSPQDPRLIDWERAGLNNNPEGEIVFMYIHEGLDRDFYKETLRDYADKMEVRKEEIFSVAEFKERAILLNDIINWAKNWEVSAESGNNEEFKEKVDSYVELYGDLFPEEGFDNNQIFLNDSRD
ncbi:phosphotransferase [Candidatus Nanohaloarchaea archaeon]|nr:phosphotransferase [Candidatus Nanohaloarchaea archaeon]